jgi:hypothetical protein
LNKTQTFTSTASLTSTRQMSHQQLITNWLKRPLVNESSRQQQQQQQQQHHCSVICPLCTSGETDDARHIIFNCNNRQLVMIRNTVAARQNNFTPPQTCANILFNIKQLISEFPKCVDTMTGCFSAEMLQRFEQIQSNYKQRQIIINNKELSTAKKFMAIRQQGCLDLLACHRRKCEEKLGVNENRMRLGLPTIDRATSGNNREAKRLIRTMNQRTRTYQHKSNFNKRPKLGIG